MSGANPDFGTTGQGVGAITRLAFGFYSYEEWKNNGYGLGTVI